VESTIVEMSGALGQGFVPLGQGFVALEQEFFNLGQ
jgi:hypothetical protein